MDLKSNFVSHVLHAYAQGAFPMADARESVETYWLDPENRGVIPLETFHVSRSLKKFMKSCMYKVTMNTAFHAVIKACAEISRKDEGDTWINNEIELWFLALHHAGHAHSIEVWDAENNLIGGVYGLAQGGCFNGESMFSHKTNASKIALVYLADHIKKRGFTLLDTQFVNDHLTQFGCLEIPREEYLRQLQSALELDVTFS